MIPQRLVDWDPVYRNAQALMAAQANSPFVQNPAKLTSDPATNRGLLYPGGTATTPRSNALTPGVFAPGAGYMAGAGGGMAMSAASGGAGAAQAPLAVKGYETMQSTASPQAGGNASKGADATLSKMPTTLDDLAGSAGDATGTAGKDAAPEMVNDFSKLKPGEQMSWDALPSTSWGAPKNGQITFEAGMPRMPGTRGPNSTGIDVGDGQGGNYSPNGTGADSATVGGASGNWYYLGNDPSKFGGYAAGGEQPIADNQRGAWQWRESPTAKNLPGLRDFILSLFSNGQQVPDNSATPATGGMLPNNQGMAPGGVPGEAVPAVGWDMLRG